MFRLEGFIIRLSIEPHLRYLRCQCTFWDRYFRQQCDTIIGETPGVDGRIMLGWIFKKWDVGVRSGLGWLRIGIGGGRLLVR
jgi:hypothetical protein